jgi:hypothetical protein
MLACLSCSNGITCDSCIDGYYLDSASICLICPPNCTACYLDLFYSAPSCISCGINLGISSQAPYTCE